MGGLKDPNIMMRECVLQTVEGAAAQAAVGREPSGLGRRERGPGQVTPHSRHASHGARGYDQRADAAAAACSAHAQFQFHVRRRGAKAKEAPGFYIVLCRPTYNNSHSNTSTTYQIPNFA